MRAVRSWLGSSHLFAGSIVVKTAVPPLGNRFVFQHDWQDHHDNKVSWWFLCMILHTITCSDEVPQ
ncbi:hypothetical protein A9Q02_12300 [Candidatus Chloroploca asiatica]|uniref:Uncharacterized protein n=1 Tax=Candidatus Chloroploca asiatica TaxID=1506545 RepID=A0A2H3L3P4_9CHLR|nr:hypothetical protein A9Q02_12300 [Candidatus Chloroploca asiatica]